MGPEEIHIFFWEGAQRPPKRKCDRPKNLEVFFSQFSKSLSFQCCCFFPLWWGGGGGVGSIEIRASSAQA